MLFMGERFLQQTYVIAIILLMNVVACADVDKDAIQPAAEAVATSVVLTYSSQFHIAVKYGEKTHFAVLSGFESQYKRDIGERR